MPLISVLSFYNVSTYTERIHVTNGRLDPHHIVLHERSELMPLIPLLSDESHIFPKEILSLAAKLLDRFHDTAVRKWTFILMHDLKDQSSP